MGSSTTRPNSETILNEHRPAANLSMERFPSYILAVNSPGSGTSSIPKSIRALDSESDSENEEHGEVLTGMYTKDVPTDSEGHPVLKKCALSEAQVAILRLAASLKSQPSRPASDYSSTSCSEGEDSVDEFYREHPEVPKFGKLVAIRNRPRTKQP
jgi:hypothetical protein